jgi:hypothetical protein
MKGVMVDRQVGALNGVELAPGVVGAIARGAVVDPKVVGMKGPEMAKEVVGMKAALTAQALPAEVDREVVGPRALVVGMKGVLAA